MTAPPRTATPPPQGAPRSMLAGIQKGRQQRLLRALWYGMPGIGKTTLAGQLPAPIFMSLDDGARHLDVDKLRSPNPDSPDGEWRHAKTFDEVRAQIRFLIEGEHDYRTLVIDVIDVIETMFRAESVSKARPFLAEKGQSYTEFAKVPFGAADRHVLTNWWPLLLCDLEGLQAKRNMHVVMLAWANEGKIGDDSGKAMTAWMPRLQHSFACSAVTHLIGWVEDALFFAWERITEEGDAAARDSRLKTGKQIVRARRVIHTMADGPWLAKNRHAMPPDLDISDEKTAADVLFAAMPDLNLGVGIIRRRINTALSGATEEVRAKVDAAMRAAGDDEAALINIENRLALTLAKGATTNE